MFRLSPEQLVRLRAVGASRVSPAPIVFPALPQQASWGQTSLAAAHAALGLDPSLPNPALNPAWATRFVFDLPKVFRKGYLMGGYMELRGGLWRGSYLPDNRQRHLGIDLNVPAGTLVASPCDGAVIFVGNDLSEGGWGGYVILQMNTPFQGARYLILGHLRYKGMRGLGARVGRGDIVGVVGTPEENGGWFPHLHVQLFSERIFRIYAFDGDMRRLREIDGYGFNFVPYDPDYPDPTRLVLGLAGLPPNV